MQCGGGAIRCTVCEPDTPSFGCQSEIIFEKHHLVLKSNFTLTTGWRGVWFTDCTPDDTPSTLHPVVIIRTGWLPCPVLKIQKMRTGWDHPGALQEI